MSRAAKNLEWGIIGGSRSHDGVAQLRRHTVLALHHPGLGEAYHWDHMSSPGLHLSGVPEHLLVEVPELGGRGARGVDLDAELGRVRVVLVPGDHGVVGASRGALELLLKGSVIPLQHGQQVGSLGKLEIKIEARLIAALLIDSASEGTVESMVEVRQLKQLRLAIDRDGCELLAPLARLHFADSERNVGREDVVGHLVALD